MTRRHTLAACIVLISLASGPSAACTGAAFRNKRPCAPH